MTDIADTLAIFREYVENISFDGADPIALDKVLGEAAILLYDVRFAIDLELAEKRAAKPTLTVVK